METLERVHQRLRRGDFGDDLLDVVRTHLREWQTSPRADLRLMGSYVVSEVLDHFGDYPDYEGLTSLCSFSWCFRYRRFGSGEYAG